MKRIVLASKSPRRKKLLENIGLKFTVAPSKISEKMNPRLKPRAQAEHLSLQKAKAVATRYKNAIIIAADTFVVLNNETLGKPYTKEVAKRMLKKLSGKIHKVITGYTIIDSDTMKTITKSEETKVKMRKISQREIEAYISSGEPLDKAGAYAVQEKGGLFVESIEGDFFNVVGFPIPSLTESLKKFGIFVLH